MGFKSVEEFLKENPTGLSSQGMRAAENRTPVLAETTEKATFTENAAGRGQRIVLKELARGLKTRYQLCRKLEQEKIPQETIGELLKRCEELQLIDDQKYASQWVQTRSAQKQLGKSILLQELVKKGVKQQYIDDALERYAIDDEELARRLVDKKLALMDPASDFKEREKYKRRLLGLLTRKGISYEVAARVIIQKLTVPVG